VEEEEVVVARMSLGMTGEEGAVVVAMSFGMTDVEAEAAVVKMNWEIADDVVALPPGQPALDADETATHWANEKRLPSRYNSCRICVSRFDSEPATVLCRR
jgi:hypothetical protein